VRVLLTIILGALLAFTQESPPSDKPAEPTFFSGSVVTTTPTLLSVHRRGLGSSAATKTFKIDSETKIEGKLRIRVNVTVRFTKEEDGTLRAIHIIVR
jgi:hypothetical protein